MTTWKCLLVSASCIVLPPMKRFGVRESEFVQDSKESMLRLKREGFATDIYVLLDSKEYKQYGVSWLQNVGFFNEKLGDLDIAGLDRVIFLREADLDVFVRERHVTHVISRDEAILGLIKYSQIKRYLFGSNREASSDFFCFSAWKDLANELLIP